MLKGNNKSIKNIAAKKAPKKAAKTRLSLYPLDLETALGAALKTGVPARKAKSKG